MYLLVFLSKLYIFFLPLKAETIYHIKINIIQQWKTEAW